METASSTASKQTTKTKMAGLVMSVSRIERNLRKGRYAKRISTGGAVFMASVLEYLSAGVLELSSDACHQNNRKQITPRHIMLAIENDSELKQLLKDVMIAEGGVMPFIHSVLLPKNSKIPNKNKATAESTMSQEI